MPLEDCMFKCVPLNAAWTGDTKLDMHAIYARPNGDLATLPMRRHNQWMAKGLTYVTLADAESFRLAAPWLQSQGLNPGEFIAGIDGDGRQTPWIPAKYLAEQQAGRADADAELKALIALHGVETVEAIRGIKVPDHLKPDTKKTKAGVAA